MSVSVYDIVCHAIDDNDITLSDVQVSLDASTYNSSESMGYVTVCAKIIMGTLGRSASVYVSTMSGTATGYSTQ